jgi:hypothetical protein
MRFLILALALVPFTTSAKDWLSHEYTESHWSIAAGWDFIHTEDEDDEAQALDKEYYEVRYRGQLYTYADNFVDTFGWSAYVGNKDTIGVGIYGTSGPFLFGWGVESAEPDALTSTEGGYELLLEWKVAENLALSVKHRSNCKSVCTKLGLDDLGVPHGDEDSHNRGWNYFTLRYMF